MISALTLAENGVGGDRLAGVAHTYLAELALARSAADPTVDPERTEAIDHAETAIRLLSGSPGLQGVPHAVLANAHLEALPRTGVAIESALAEATAALNLLEVSVLEEGEALVRLTHAKALAAAGAKSASREALRVAKARLDEEAARISDAETRERFLNLVPENAETSRLALEWGLAPI